MSIFTIPPRSYCITAVRDGWQLKLYRYAVMEARQVSARLRELGWTVTVTRP